MGDFDEVKTLTNPEPQAMQYEVETLFSGRSKDDFVLLFFSGHGIKDDSNNLYFATRITQKSAKGDLIRSTAVEARFVHEVMNNSRAKRQAIILDCCFSGAFDPNLLSKDDGSVDLQGQLGAEGRVVLTSSSSTQYSFEQQGSDLSLYTRYLIEGIETGAGDRDEDGKISMKELHEYATSKVQETAPSMTPKLITLKDLGFDLVLAKAKVTDPNLRYRRQVEKYSSRGAISSIGRTILDRLQIQLKLSGQIAKEIETEVLRPYQERLDNLQRYQQAFEEAVKNEYPFSNYVQSELEDLLEVLGLRREDVDSVEQEIITRFQAARGECQQNSQRYEEEFRRVVESEYPLSPHGRNGLNDLQTSLGLNAEDITRIESPILQTKESELKNLEADKLHQEQKTVQNRTDTSSTLDKKKQLTSAKQKRNSFPVLDKRVVFAAIALSVVVGGWLIFFKSTTTIPTVEKTPSPSVTPTALATPTSSQNTKKAEEEAKLKAAKDAAAKKSATDKAAAEQAARDQAAAEQAARDQAAAEQATRDQAAAEQAARDQAPKDPTPTPKDPTPTPKDPTPTPTSKAPTRPYSIRTNQ